MGWSKNKANMSYESQMKFIDEKVAFLLNQSGCTPEAMTKIIELNQTYDKLKELKAKEDKEVEEIVCNPVTSSSKKKYDGSNKD